MFNLNLSENETRATGLRVGRADRMQSLSSSELLSQICDKQLDVCRLKINSVNEPIFDLLNATGIPWYIHSILVRNKVSVGDEISNTATNIHIVLYEETLELVMKDLVAECLKSKTATFYTNPYIAELINEETEIAMATAFLSGFIHQKDSSQIAWVVYVDDRPAGFIAGSLTALEFEGVYYGVLPAFRGQYNLAKIIMRHIKHYCMQNNIPYFCNDVPYQNLPSLTSIIRESVLPVETYLHIILYPLVKYTIKNAIHKHKIDGFDITQISHHALKLCSAFVQPLATNVSVKSCMFNRLTSKQEVNAEIAIVSAKNQNHLYICAFYGHLAELIAVTYLEYKIMEP